MSLAEGESLSEESSLDNTGKRVSLVDGDTLEEETSLDNTGRGMTLKEEDAKKEHRTSTERVQWEEKKLQRKLTPHERKLIEEEFAEERMQQARDTFRSRFNNLPP